MAIDGLIIEVHVHPGSRHEGVGGRHAEALVVRVRARAVDGAANEEVLATLSRAFALPRHAVSFHRVTRSREKRVILSGDAALLRRRLAELLGAEG